MAEQKFMEIIYGGTASDKTHLVPVGGAQTLCGKSAQRARQAGGEAYEMSICKFQDIAAEPARYCGSCSTLAARQAGLS